MSYLKSSFNLCVFKVAPDLKLNKSEIYDKLFNHKFKDLTPSEEFGIGFVDISDMFKTSFTMEESTAGEYLLGGFRIDKKNVSNPLVKKLYKEKLGEKKKEGIKLDKQDKQLLKDECRKELIIKTLPNPKSYHWIWNFTKGEIYLDSKSAKVIDSFRILFNNTFESSLSVKDFGLNLDQYSKFLDWLWEKKNDLESLWFNNNVSFDFNDMVFNFSGPGLSSFTDEINTFKNDKPIAKIGLGVIIDKLDYEITLNNKDFVVAIKNADKIKHESVETAIIDNGNRIEMIILKIEQLIKQFEK